MSAIVRAAAREAPSRNTHKWTVAAAVAVLLNQAATAQEAQDVRRVPDESSRVARLPQNERARLVQFDIAAQPLNEALTALGAQAGLTIIVETKVSKGLTSSALSGTYTTEEALSQLLTPVGLRAEYLDSKTVTVKLTSEGNPQTKNIVRTDPILRVAQAVGADPDQQAQTDSVPVGSQSEKAPEEVVVSSTRIVRDGYQAPTPLTVASGEDIAAAAAPEVGEYLSKLPSFGTAFGARNPSNLMAGGSAGLSLVNLRNLGVNRTLVLFDGRRVVDANVNGGVDLNLIPDSLLQRVDIVTGGASAAWGSDAVAGVVNVIVNKTFEGFQVRGEGGASTHGDASSYKGEITAGTSFASGKGHILGSFTYTNTPNRISVGDRSWVSNPVAIPNPAYTGTNGEPRLILAGPQGSSRGTAGGLITGGPLANTQFIGPEGTPAPYAIDVLAGAVAIGPDADQSTMLVRGLQEPVKRNNFYGSATYALNDSINANVELNYSLIEASLGTNYYSRLGNITITDDNPFIPAETRAAMAANSVTSFPLGVINANLGGPGSDNERRLLRGVVGLDGRLAGDWKWNAYYTRGEVRNYQELFNNPLVPNYNRAIDAVTDPATGQAVCRSTLTDPSNGCSPLNLFGNGVASAAAINYINGTRAEQLIRTSLDVIALSATGSPFETWAGPLDLAVGVEARRQAAEADGDALSQARLYFAGNFQDVPPVSVNVKEAFLETNVPVAFERAWARSLNLNAAVRTTDYDTSGSVITWKAGMVYEPTDQFRFRLTRSRDIRAPTLNELFSPGQSGTTVAFDPFTNTTATYQTHSGGNPNLEPELGDTWTGGVVFTSAAVPGLQASIDYFQIEITDAIRAPSGTEILQGCLSGIVAYCQFIHRDAAGVLTSLDLVPANVSEATVRGVDLEVGYRRRLGPGDVRLRLVGAYNLELSTLINGQYTDLVESVGSDTPTSTSGIPKIKLSSSLRYELNPFTVGLDLRALSEAETNSYWTGADIAREDNEIPAVMYLDLRGSYDFELFGSQAHSYLAIDNLLDRNPPAIPVLWSGGTFGTRGTNQGLYDTLGRMIRVGVRVEL